MQHASEVQGCWEKLNFDHPLLNLLRYLNALESFFNLSKTEVDAADIAAKLQDILRPNESGACSSLEGCSPRLGETPRRGGATERRVTSHKIIRDCQTCFAACAVGQTVLSCYLDKDGLVGTGVVGPLVASSGNCCSSAH